MGATEFGLQPGAGEGTDGSGPGRGVRRGRSRRRVWLVRIGVVVLVVLAVVGGVVEYVLHNAEPILRRRVIATLEERFHSPVELDALHISLVQGLEVVAELSCQGSII